MIEAFYSGTARRASDSRHSAEPSDCGGYRIVIIGWPVRRCGSTRRELYRVAPVDFSYIGKFSTLLLDNVESNQKKNMNLNTVSKPNKVVFFALALVSTISLGLLIYTLVYASPESIYKEYDLMVGIWFIVVVRFTISFYKKIIAHE